MNEAEKVRMVWMMDETLANAHPANWSKVKDLEGELIDEIGHPDFNHQVIDPRPCLRDLAGQLKGRQVSCIFDMTGWLTPVMNELFPDVPVMRKFALSRVRVVSSPTLETTGYTVSMSPREIESARQDLDLSRPLIVDDASFSGWTSRKTMDLWQMDPDKTTHGFLIANTGSLGPQPGAVKMIESLGSQVIFGHELHTPNDDGWHLKDLHQNPNLEQSFVLALLFQEAVQKGGVDSPIAQGFFDHQTVIRTQFPDHMTSQQIKERLSQGRFVLRNDNVIDGQEIHARNPFLWASRYFQESIDLNKILANKDRIVTKLLQLQALTSCPTDRELASVAFRREVQQIPSTF